MDITVKKQLEQAKIPPVAYELRLQDCGPTADVIREYLSGPNLAADVGAGIGAVVYGRVDVRRKVFMAFARGMQLMTQACYYVSLKNLMLAVTVDHHPMFEDVSTAKGLFVSDFHDDSIPTPLTFSERMFVEEFLSSRSDHRLRNYYSISGTMTQADWWSMGFRAHQDQVSRKLVLE